MSSTTNGDSPSSQAAVAAASSASSPSSPRSPTKTSNTASPSSPTSPNSTGRPRGSTGVSLKSVTEKFKDSSPPMGMWSATGEAAAKAPSLLEIRRGSYTKDGWSGEGQRRNSQSSARTPTTERRRSDNAVEGVSSRDRSSTGSGGQPGTARTRTSSGFAAVAEHEDRGELPAGVFGRGEMDNQCYVPGPKAAQSANATKPQIDGAHAELDDEDEDVYPKPKRNNKKDVSAMLGQTPQTSYTTSDTLTDGQTPGNPEKVHPDENGTYPNGYHFPAKHTWWQSTVIGTKALGKYSITPLGFLVVLYGLNVVAWGGMLFLLLIGGGKQFMCFVERPSGSGNWVHDCEDIDSPRRIWIEIDSQILNALFCVTGFGLIPWRFRDFYYLLKFRVGKNYDGLRKLAGYHNSWFRLAGSEQLPAVVNPVHLDNDNTTHEDLLSTGTLKGVDNSQALPIPLTKTPTDPLTGVRAPATALWKMDYVIWAFIANTALQAVLSGFMWGMNRYDRPSWSTGTFVALACIVAALGGLMQFQEGKKVKNVEGVPLDAKERLQDAERTVGTADEKRNVN